MRNEAQEDLHVWSDSCFISSKHTLIEQVTGSWLMTPHPVMHVQHHSFFARKDITKEITFIDDRLSLSCHADPSSSKRMT